MQPDLTLGLLALAFFTVLPSLSVDGLRNSSVGRFWDEEESYVCCCAAGSMILDVLLIECLVPGPVVQVV